MALKRKEIATNRHQTKKNANIANPVTEIKVTELSRGESVAKQSFAGLIEHKEKINGSLREG